MTERRRERVPGEALVPTRGTHYVQGEHGPLVGVLALQGDVLEHLTALAAAGARALPVKHAEQLDLLDGLLIPGGESTTIGKLAVLYGLLEPLKKRISEGLPTLGTCAGAILLARRALDHDGEPSEQPLLDVMDTVVRRNAFGRQVASFETDVTVRGISGGPMHAVFIRAPWIEQWGPDVEILASAATALGDKVVVARQGSVLASAFHPELTADTRLHALLVDLVNKES